MDVLHVFLAVRPSDQTVAPFPSTTRDVDGPKRTGLRGLGFRVVQDLVSGNGIQCLGLRLYGLG